jgi:hypothetical protein
MSRTELDLSDERLGEALGRAMYQHVGSEAAQRSARGAEIGAVRAGARRRQNTRRIALSTACVGLIAVAGVAVVNRAGSTEPVPPASQPGPAAASMTLPAFASLDASAGLVPQLLYADAGGSPNGAPLPSVDVWEAGGTRIVVRTWPSATTSTDATAVSTLAETATTAVSEFDTTEPWRDRGVEPITVRGVAGAVEALDEDQFEWWIPSTTSDAYTVVATRGLDRGAALAQVEGLGDAAGVLQPMDGFTRTERVSGSPVSTPSAPFSQVSYGLENGPWVASWHQPVDATTVDGTVRWPGSRQTVIEGRDVLVWRTFGRANVQWLEPSGVVVQIGVVGTEADALAIVSQVRMIDQPAFLALAAGVSRWVEQELPVTSSIDLGGLQIERRNDTGRIALCVRTPGSENQCAAAQEMSEGVIDFAVIVDGRWYAVGHRPLTEDYTPDVDALSFDLDGNGAAPVVWSSTDAGIWYVADLGTARTSTTNLGTILGGVTGTVSRPLVPSTFG